MSDSVAIISVVSSATVAITVPFIGALLERQRLRYQERQARFAELRTLLDGSAEHLIEAHTVVSRVLTDLGEMPATDGPRGRLIELAVAVFRDNTRLALRLGDKHEAVVAHGDAMNSLHTSEGRIRTTSAIPTHDDRGSLGVTTGAFLRAAGKIVAAPATRPL